MRIPIIAGNWKMNNTLVQARTLAKDIIDATTHVDDVEIVLAPTFISLESVCKATVLSKVKVAAQHMHTAQSGAFTGAISATMIKDVGCSYVILGHSERRQLFGETDEGVNRKLHMALEHGLTPIICIGESLTERETGQTEVKVHLQVRAALANVTVEQLKKVVLAYEPIWAIGTGLTATPKQAQQVHASIRALLIELYDAHTAESVRIQYGGSVKPANIAELIAQKDIDGALVGGASLKADSFVAIIKAAQHLNKK